MSPISSQVILPTEVIHGRSPNPYLYWRGMSPLLVAMLPASADYAAEQFMKGLLANNADTGVVVCTDQQVSPEQREAMRAALRERKRKAGTPDRPLFLWGGARVEKPTVSSADLQFLENRKLNRQEIAAIFKVPESMMGFTEQKAKLGGGGGNAIEAEKLNFIQNALTPHCRRLEAAVAPIVKSFDPSLYGWFDIEGLPIMQEARRLRLDSAVKAFGMAVPFNEINAVYDLGFPATPWGNKGYLPRNLVEVGTAPTADEIPPDNDANQAAANPFARLITILDSLGEGKDAFHRVPDSSQDPLPSLNLNLSLNLNPKADGP